MKVFSKKSRRIFLCLLVCGIVAFACFAAYPACNAKKESEPQSYRGVLRVWHIDSFEGGTGSRAAFLRNAAKTFEQKSGMYVLVTAHTAESAALAAEEGILPDVLSFGSYLDFAADDAKALRGFDFAYAEQDGKTYAVPWCRGNYFLFTSEGDFSDVGTENTVISDGGTLVDAAAFAEGMTGEYAVEESVRAYVSFLNGKYKYLLGTQRDLFRFRTRGAEVQAKPLSSFCDLYQYLSICTDDPALFSAAEEFVDCILSEEVQGKLSQIGMISVSGDCGSSEPALQAAQQAVPSSGVSVFLSGSVQTQLREAARAARKGDKNGAIFLQKILS